MELGKMLENSSTKMYSSEVASQDKMIIRIKKQEHDVDIESKDSSLDQEDIVSYTCEFVKKDDETLSDFSDICDDDSMESFRQDENFIYPAITNSDDEDTKDATWQPPINILTPSERLSLKNMKCLNPKVGKSVPKKNKKTTKEPAAKRLKKEQSPKIKKVLEDIDVSKQDTDLDQSVETTSNELVTKKNCDSLTPKVYKPRKGMATPKQRLGRILKIHKMMKK